MTEGPHRLRIAVLLSGNGTSLENLLEHIDSGAVDAEVVAVISSKPEAYGLERARQRGIPALSVPRKDYPDLERFNDALHKALDGYKVDLIALLGFLSLFQLRGRYLNRVLNVHPALIPAFSGQGFYGKRVYEAVLATGVKVTGATVHFTDDQYDNGPILLQEAIAVKPDDTPETLAQRVTAVERRLVPRAIQLIAQGRVQIREGRTQITPGP
ncbi:MAG: phosphoribosylglycinamide formyltransferase [Deltaproteobacteria bacterium]|nr:phosphoribosylglycinamide formyltransferase [Deltaproteobacteria bacterium]